MKTNLKNCLLTTVAALGVSTCAYADFNITLDSGPLDSEWSQDVTWSAGPTGYSGAGAAQATAANGGWTLGAGGGPVINFDYSSGHQPDMWNIIPTGNGHLAFDIVVDGSSFNANAQWWQIIVAGNSGTGGWQQTQVLDLWQNAAETDIRVYHVDMTLAQLGFTAVNDYYILNFGANSDGANPLHYYIDNINVYTATTVTPTNYIAKATAPQGLNATSTTNVTVDAVQYQRQGIRTTHISDTYFNWYGSPSPMTYSMTITNFPPGATCSNYTAQMFLVEGPLATEPNPDWVQPDVLIFSVQNRNDGSAVATVQYKGNQPNGNSQYYSTGNRGSVSNSSPLGTWSITFTGNDNFTVTTPQGNTLNSNLVSGDASLYFTLPLEIYVGAQPNDTNASTGQTVVFSKVEVLSNSVPLLNETFTSPALAANTWALAAEDPAGILYVPNGSVYEVSWTLPDGGFSLNASHNLASPGWYNPGLPRNVINGRGVSFVTSAMLTTNTFFRMIKP